MRHYNTTEEDEEYSENNQLIKTAMQLSRLYHLRHKKSFMIWLKQKSVLQQMNITLAALKNELDYTFHHSRLTLNKINAINIERVLSTHNIKNWRKREKELAQQVNIKSSHYNSQSEKCVIQQEKVSQCSQLTLKYEKKMEKIKIMLVTINNNSHF